MWSSTPEAAAATGANDELFFRAFGIPPVSYTHLDVYKRQDNMLRITNDGRKLALDMRLINPLAADDPNGKVAVCARNVYKIWERCV